MAIKKIGLVRLFEYKRLFVIPLLFMCVTAVAQPAYFIDGYHGGVYGHYPVGYTNFIVKQLKDNPRWKINLEIEPETWDSVLVREPEALKELQQLFADQSVTGRIEYVSPAYGQSYMYNISGESIIRQFLYGIQKVRQHFPQAVFTSYSSEEPCFTSALPQILNSFGYKYASLKNPNTCWGGYTRAFGGELVNWIGPDGTKIITVPRYAIEGLLPNSTWQTEAWTNSPKFIKAAFNYGIKHPVAMTLQDAGWRNGPWIGNGNRGYQPTIYKTWRGYITNSSIRLPKQDWKFSQEDVLVSLVWGSQVLQKIAQQVRVSENKIVIAEKLAALSKVYNNNNWPKAAIDEAWRSLMLSQHHDCWIVPYNGRPNNTWIDKVKIWTGATDRISDSLIHVSVGGNANTNVVDKNTAIRVYNSTGYIRNEVVQVMLPANVATGQVRVVNGTNHQVVAQVSSAEGNTKLTFMAEVPAMGFNTYSIVSKPLSAISGATASTLANGNVVLENDLYKVEIDKVKGSIKSLVAKTLNNKEFVDDKNERGFNELSGNFFNNGGLHTSSENGVSVTIVEQGPALVKAEIRGTLLTHPFVQTITLKQGDKKIDCKLRINWQGNVGIGNNYKQAGGLEAKDYTKPFYDDSKKLLALFPLNLAEQKIYKDAPFDVTESTLDNTFFTRWDSIKNNIMVNWVDAYDSKNNLGLALLTDHTTTYTHGKNFPLGLNVQYSGAGLWGRNHTITGPTEINYALVPHAGMWNQAHLVTEAANWNEPLLAVTTPADGEQKRSLVDVTGSGLQVTTVLAEGNDLLIRLFNAEGNSQANTVTIAGQATAANLVELNGSVRQALKMQKAGAKMLVKVAMPRFGIRTLRLKNFKAN